MAKPTDFVQGTLDLLILKTISLEPKHGWAIAKRIQQVSQEALQIQQGSLYPVWSSRPGSRPSGARPRPGEWQNSTPLRVLDGSNWNGNWRTGFVCRRR